MSDMKTTTPVRAALTRPVPAAIPKAATKSDEALAAFRKAKAALDEIRYRPFDRQVEEAKTAHAKACARLEVARMIDGDTPELGREVDLLRRAYDDAVAQAASRAALQAALVDEVDRRREALSEADEALARAIAAWSNPVLVAADEQLAAAANLAEEARQAAAGLRPRDYAGAPVDFVKLLGGGRHHGTANVTIPAEIEAANRSWSRAYGAATAR